MKEEIIRRILYESKELLSCHYYAARNDKDYPMECDLEEIRIVIKKLQSLLNSDQNDERIATQQAQYQGGNAGIKKSKEDAAKQK